MPRFVEDAMADIMTVLQMTTKEMDDMFIEELMEWRERARVRSQVEKD